MSRTVRAWTGAGLPGTGRARPCRPGPRRPGAHRPWPSWRGLPVPRTRLTLFPRSRPPLRSVSLLGAGTILSSARPVWVSATARGMGISAHAGLAAGAVRTRPRSVRTRTRLAWPVLLWLPRSRLSRSELFWSEWSLTWLARSVRARAGLARSVGARARLPRTVMLLAGLPRTVMLLAGLPRTVMLLAGLRRTALFPAGTVPGSAGAVGLFLPRGARPVPGAWPAGLASGLSLSAASGVRAAWRDGVEPVLARGARGSWAAIPGDPRSVRAQRFFRSGRAAAIRALRPGATARRRPRAGAADAGHGVLRTQPRAVKEVLVGWPLPGWPRREPGAWWRAAFRAGTRRPGGHVSRAGAATGVSAIAGVDGVSTRVQVRLIGVAAAVQVHGVRGSALRAPAGSAVPTIHPVPPGHSLFGGRHGKPLRMTSPACPASPAGVRHSSPRIECRRAGAPGQRRRGNCPGSTLLNFSGQRPRAWLLRAREAGYSGK
jgi:hypothetical protein